VMGDEQRTQGILGGDPAGVADDVGIPGLEPEELLDGEARVPCRPAPPPCALVAWPDVRA
ncbi:MAG: hypothetical protein WA188_11175, partial [Terriglobales bacterium]